MARFAITCVMSLVWLCLCVDLFADELGMIGLYEVHEIDFAGPTVSAKETPARDIRFAVTFQHESGAPQVKVHGFWDGNGKGGASGDMFKVRFCPTKSGKWTLANVESSHETLRGQKQGDTLAASESKRAGFWLIDRESAGSRWYKRSNGSHPYIFGNTHYSFLSGYREGGEPSGNDIAADVRANAAYFKKLRFALHGDRYPDPRVKPYFDDDGRPTDDGDYSHRPNPAWFHRADVAVRVAGEVDLIADLILCGPDTDDSRVTLRAERNGGDPLPYLRYIAARYGSYPHVWMCLCNEYDIKQPKYSEASVARWGQILREHLPYPTPVSVHASQNVIWSSDFDELPAWNDHQIVQRKLKALDKSADTMQAVWRGDATKPRDKPSINDELSYEGAGDKHSEEDTIESHLGAFLGGGYASTGYKPGNKLGQYFIGRFEASEHKSADNLRFLRQVIDENITFWRMAPDTSIFSNFDKRFRGLAWPEHEYVIGTSGRHAGIVANLPSGEWKVVHYDVVAMNSKVLSERASGEFRFDSPESRAVLFHFQRIDIDRCNTGV